MEKTLHLNLKKKWFDMIHQEKRKKSTARCLIIGATGFVL